MTEEAQQQTETTETQQSAAPELPDDIKAQLEDLERYKAKHAEAEKHRKAAEQRAKELEESQRLAEEDRLKKEGEFQKLYESEAEKAARLQREMEEKESIWREKEKARQGKEIQAQAIQDMHAIAVDEPSLELLAEKARQFAVYTENGVEYEIGGVKVPKEKVIETLSTRYPRLIKGSGATGGGATGGSRGGASNNQNSAAEAAKKRRDLTGYITATLNQK